MTFQDQALHLCTDCQKIQPNWLSLAIKHVTELKHHMDETDPDYKTIEKIADAIAKHVGMNPEEYKTYDKILEVEHKLQDYETVLRDMRRKVQAGESSNPGRRREYKPYAWTACERAYPQIQRKMMSCIKQVEKKQCPPNFTSYKECTANPVAVCRSSLRCPPWTKTRKTPP